MLFTVCGVLPAVGRMLMFSSVFSCRHVWVLFHGNVILYGGGEIRGRRGVMAFCGHLWARRPMDTAGLIATCHLHYRHFGTRGSMEFVVW